MYISAFVSSIQVYYTVLWYIYKFQPLNDDLGVTNQQNTTQQPAEPPPPVLVRCWHHHRRRRRRRRHRCRGG